MDEKGRVFVQENPDVSEYLRSISDCWGKKKDSFSFVTKSFVFLCYYRLISTDLLESKTEIISSTGYKNAFKEMYPFILIFKKR